MPTRSLLPAVVLLSCLCGHHAAWGAPMAPQRRLPDTVRALAGVTEVRLVIASVHEELIAAGLVANRLREAWVEQLADAGVALALPRSSARR